MTLRELFTAFFDCYFEWAGRIILPIDGILDLKIGEELFHIDLADRLVVYPICGIAMVIAIWIASKEHRRIRKTPSLFIWFSILIGVFWEVLYWIVYFFFWIATQPIAL